MSNVENMVQEVAEKEVLDNEASAAVWFTYVILKSISAGLDKEKVINAFRQITETEESHELDCVFDVFFDELAKKLDVPYEDFIKKSKKYEVKESSISERNVSLIKLYQTLMASFEEEPVEEN